MINRLVISSHLTLVAFPHTMTSLPPFLKFAYDVTKDLRVDPTGTKIKAPFHLKFTAPPGVSPMRNLPINMHEGPRIHFYLSFSSIVFLLSLRQRRALLSSPPSPNQRPLLEFVLTGSLLGENAAAPSTAFNLFFLCRSLSTLAPFPRRSSYHVHRSSS